jgi:hypothetical protein
MRETVASPDATSQERKVLSSDIRYAERTLETLRDGVARKKRELWGDLDGEGRR